MLRLTCLSEQELHDYLLGEAPAAELDAVAAHLEECSACQAAVAALDRLADPLVDGLRKYHPAPLDGSNGPGGRTGPLTRSHSGRCATHRQTATPPGYEILDVLGRGGMGVVYRARQVGVGRIVALKMVLAGDLATPEERQRFRFEAELLGQLSHPNVVQIHEAGCHEGLPFFALELVTGGSLAARLKRGPLSSREAAALVERLARGVHHAHLHGIVHRDLKPANILLAADGAAKVSDFGLGRRITQAAAGALTEPGAILGTPAYMAPEQAYGGRQIGPAADVYALGAILYECLTGEPPFTGETPAEVLAMLLTREAPSVSRPSRPTPPDLTLVCHRCLEKDPAHRYVSAEALADDLGRFLSGEPVLARPVGPLIRLAKWARRRPAVAALSATLAGLVIVAFAVVLHQKHRADQFAFAEGKARTKAEATTARLAEALALNRVQAAASALDEGAALCEKGDAGRGLTALARGLVLAHEAGDAVLERAARYNLTAWSRRFVHHRATCKTNSSCTSAVLSPDGRTLLTGTPEGEIRIWDVAAGAPRRAALHAGHPLRSVVFGPAPCETAVSGGESGSEGVVEVWDLRSGKVLRSAKTPESVRLVQSRPGDGRTFLTVGEQSVQLWSVESCQRVGGALSLSSNPQVRSGVAAACFSPDGRFVLAAGFLWTRGRAPSGVMRTWEVESGRLTGQFSHSASLVSAAFSSDGRLIAAGGADGVSRVWRVCDGKTIGEPHRHVGSVLAVAISPDGRLLATGNSVGTSGPLPGRDTGVPRGQARVWDLATGKPITAPLPHDGPVRTVAFSPDSRRLLTGSIDGLARLFSTADGGLLVDPMVAGGNANVAEFSADGRLALTAGVGCYARLWELPQEHAGALIAVEPRLNCLAYAADGARLATGSNQGVVQVWDVRSRVERHRLIHGGEACDLAFTASEQLVVAGVRVPMSRWDLRTGRRDAVSPIAAGPTGYAISPDGDRVVGKWGDSLWLWDRSMAPGVKLPLQVDPYHRALWCPDGKALVVMSGRNGSTVRRELGNWRILTDYAWPEGYPRAVSRDGRVLLLRGANPSHLRAFSLIEGSALGPPMVHMYPIRVGALSPDGALVLAGGDQARFYDPASGRAVGPILSLRGAGGVTALAFRPTGRQAAIGWANAIQIVEAPEPMPGEPQEVRRRIERLTAPGVVQGREAAAR